MVSSLENCKFRFFVLLCLFSITSCSFCEPPDVPAKGSYFPVQNQYPAGYKIRYVCEDSFLMGCEERRCEPSGRWSDVAPFCDLPVALKNPASSSKYNSNLQKAIDKNISTCFSTQNSTDHFFSVYLEKPASVNIIRLSLPKGFVNLKITLDGSRHCGDIFRNLEEQQWLQASCLTNRITEWIHLRDISSGPNALAICEVQVFAKGRFWCQDPPNVVIPNGWLRISRDIATLQCKTGFKPEQYTTIVCDTNGKWSHSALECKEIQCDFSQTNDTVGGEWRIVKKQSKLSIGTKKKLGCYEGYKMVGEGPDTIECLPTGIWTSSSVRCEKLETSGLGKKHTETILAVAVVVIIIILICSALVVFLILRKKSKQVVVVVRQSETGSGTYNESEYSNITYETIGTLQLPHPTPPRSRRPIQVQAEYANTVDMTPPPYNESEGYTNTLEETEKIKSDTLKSLKNCPVYR